MRYENASLSRRACLLAATMLAGLSLGTEAAAEEAPAPAADAATLGEVVVTAQRREEKGQDVPIAITAFASQRLQQQNITTPQDLQATVPSLVVGANGQGSRESQTFTLRGQGTTFQASPGVVVYMNEVPLPSAITLGQQGGPGNFVDLESLQVLAGPQGTLFGRNTTGGAVLLVPKKPTNDFSGYIEGKKGNYNDTEWQAAVNIPIVADKLLVRLVGAYQDRDGYTDDVTWHVKRDDVHWSSQRLGVTFRPTDRIENYLMVYGANSRNNGTGLKLQGFNIDGLKAVGFCVDPPTPARGVAVSCNVYRNLVTQAQELGPRAVALDVDEYQSTRTWGAEDTFRYQLNDELAIRNIVSYQSYLSHYLYDGDGSTVQQADVNPVRLPPGYKNATPEDRARDNLRDFTEELQVQGDMLDKHLVFTAGGFFYDQRPNGLEGGGQVNYCPALLTGSSLCPSSLGQTAVSNRSKALYAQSTLDLGAVTPALEGLRLTTGYRYTWDTITGVTGGYTPQANGALKCSNQIIITSPDQSDRCLFRATLHSSAPSWTIGLDDKIRPNLLVYAKVSRGYKSGGFNALAVRDSTRVFQPEFVTSYETGFKSNFYAGDVPMRLNTSYYYLNYKNIQRATSDFNTATGRAGAQILGASARIQGIEVEATAKPIPQVELGGTFSYTDAKYKQFNYPVTTPTIDCSGRTIAVGQTADASCLPFQYVAPQIFSVHMTADLPMPEELGALTLFVNYSHTSHQHTEAVILPQFQPGERLDGFGLLNAALDWNNIAHSGVDAGLFVTNATNALYRISNSDVYQIGSLLTWTTIYGEPRMFGARVRYRFGAER